MVASCRSSADFRNAGGCTRDSDVSFCPTKSTWGLSFDDGPAPSTPKLLNYLASVNLLSTFFVVGSRVVASPQILQSTYMAGHRAWPFLLRERILIFCRSQNSRSTPGLTLYC